MLDKFYVQVSRHYYKPTEEFFFLGGAKPYIQENRFSMYCEGVNRLDFLGWRLTSDCGSACEVGRVVNHQNDCRGYTGLRFIPP